MKKLICLLSIFLVLLVSSLVSAGSAKKPDDDKGFDEFGYNYQARIFVGKADGVDRVLDGKVWGDPTYANDWLVMKWSKAWDDARFYGKPWTPDAWCINEWNDAVPGGSGEVCRYKIIWVGPELENSPYWREGGYPIWGQFEVVMDHGIFAGEHLRNALVTPNGLGSSRKPS
ncbi:MAG: hypothetical protein QXM89_04915 [Candidatus Bathyarchaeia archaeon]